MIYLKYFLPVDHHLDRSREITLAFYTKIDISVLIFV